MNTMEQAAKTEAVWREFHERLRAFVSRRVKRPADVEDILQDASCASTGSSRPFSKGPACRLGCFRLQGMRSQTIIDV